MHAFPQWAMVLMDIITHPAFWIALPTICIAIVVLIVRAVVRVLRRRSD